MWRLRLSIVLSALDRPPGQGSPNQLVVILGVRSERTSDPLHYPMILSIHDHVQQQH
jgi:hypothetical protein